MKAFRPSAVEEAVAAWEREVWGSLTHADRDEISRLHATGRHPARALARRFKVSLETVRRVLRAAEG